MKTVKFDGTAESIAELTSSAHNEQVSFFDGNLKLRTSEGHVDVPVGHFVSIAPEGLIVSAPKAEPKATKKAAAKKPATKKAAAKK